MKNFGFGFKKARSVSITALKNAANRITFCVYVTVCGHLERAVYLRRGEMYMYSANHNQRHYIIRWMIFKSNTSKDKFKSCFGEYNRFEYWVLRSYVSNVMMSKLLKADNWVSRQKKVEHRKSSEVSFGHCERRTFNVTYYRNKQFLGFAAPHRPSAVCVLGHTRS